MKHTYRFAELNIGVTSVHDEIHSLCSDYLADGAEAVFDVETDQGDIDYEFARSAREDEYEGRPVRRFTDSYLETLAVYRKIAEKMPCYDTLLFHGSCVAVDGKGYLFAASSGTGKSTHTRLWRQLLGSRAVMINDDKPLIRIKEDGAVIFGTPWDGKHRLSTNTGVPLKGLCILERAGKNSIRRISASEAFPMLLQQAYRPQDADAMDRTLALLDRLAASVPLWRLGCNMDIEAAKVAYRAMSSENQF